MRNEVISVVVRIEFNWILLKLNFFVVVLMKIGWRLISNIVVVV